MHNIPKIVHQIWIGPNKPGEKIKNCMDNTKNIFKDFEYMLWDNDNIPKMPSNVQEQFEKYGKMGIPAFQADILRLYVLNIHGGLFLDADFYVKQNFFHIIQKPFWCVAANAMHLKHVFNGIFACEKNNPILSKIINEMKDETNYSIKRGGLSAAGHGPFFLSKYIREFANIPAKCSIFQYLKKYPDKYVQCESNLEFERGKYTRHLFLGSWKKAARAIQPPK